MAPGGPVGLHSPVSYADLNLGTIQKLLPHSFLHQVYELPLEAPPGRERLGLRHRPKNYLPKPRMITVLKVTARLALQGKEEDGGRCIAYIHSRFHPALPAGD